MAVTSITDLKGEGSRSGHWHVGQGRSYQRKLQVITNSVFDGPATVMSQVGAQYGDIYNAGYGTEFDGFCYCQSVDCDPVGDDGLQWEITLGYGWYDAATAGGGPTQDPLAMPIEVSWGLRDHETVLDTDQDGNAVLNTAGDPYDPPIVIDDPRLVMTVVRNERAFNVGWVLAYRNAVNSDTFAGFPPLTCKVLNISSRSQWHQDAGWYYQTTYEFEFLTASIDYDTQTGYRKRIISQGFRAVSVVTGKPYHITLKGVPVNSPMLLDEKGLLLAPGATPYWQTFQAYPELPFAVFGFDPNAISGQRSGRNAPPGGTG
jgi:hypothetical protein